MHLYKYISMCDTQIDIFLTLKHILNHTYNNVKYFNPKAS